MDHPKTKEELIERQAQQIAVLEEENERLKGEHDKLLRRLAHHRESSPAAGGSVEVELYPGEKMEILVEVVRDARYRLLEGSRRADIIDDFLRGNPTRNLPAQKGEKLKKILKGYKVLDAATRSKLEDLGIDIEVTKKHYKLRYYGDSRYTLSLPCSGSDNLRGGKNSASNIIKRFF